MARCVSKDRLPCEHREQRCERFVEVRAAADSLPLLRWRWFESEKDGDLRHTEKDGGSSQRRMAVHGVWCHHEPTAGLYRLLRVFQRPLFKKAAIALRCGRDCSSEPVVAGFLSVVPTPSFKKGK